MKTCITILTLFLSAITFGQFCDDFNDKDLTNWQGVAAAPNVINNSGPTGNSNDYFLHSKDASGYSYIYNDKDYRGNWQEYDKQCLCWDFQVINDGNLGEPLSPRLVIYTGSPTNPTASATFTATVQTTEGAGWVHICAPIKVLEVGDNFPSNANGSWNMSAGSTANDWNNLLQNISGIRFVLDLTSNISEEYGYDNICIQDCDIQVEPTDEGSFCCNGENLVENGNFEFGNTGFLSDYTNDGTLYPGAYNVANNAGAFDAEIKDHSYCANPSVYTNSNFLLVNEKTTQPTGTTSVIWEQNIPVSLDKKYKFCANFKNLPQCRFDILPEVQLEINGNLYPWQIINTTTDKCDWQNIEECFTGEEDTVNIKIHLSEEGLGDGNDLAIDDIAVQEKLSQNLSITVQHQGLPKTITASVNSINTSDDILAVNDVCVKENNGNQYYWFVFELDSYPFTTLGDNMVPGTFAWSSNQAGFSQSTGALSSTWNLTTTLQDYVFDDHKLYIIGMYVPTCCNSCYDEAWTYQLTLNSVGAKGTESNGALSIIMKEEIKAMFTEFSALDTHENISNDESFFVYPNPTSDFLYLSSELSNYLVIDVSGSLIQKEENTTKIIDIKSLKTGMYILKGKTIDGKTHKVKFIKQ